MQAMGASAPRTLNPKAPCSTASSMAATPVLTPRTAACTARVAACVADDHAAAMGTAKTSSVAPMNRAGELNPPHHMWYAAVTTVYGTTTTIHSRQSRRWRRDSAASPAAAIANTGAYTINPYCWSTSRPRTPVGTRPMDIWV